MDVAPLVEVASAHRPTASTSADSRLHMLYQSKSLASTFLQTFDHVPPGREHANAMALHDAILGAELWWVSSDMVALIESAAPSMPQQPMMPGDQPCLRGLAFLGTPLCDPDIGNNGVENVYTNALLWMPIRNKAVKKDSLTIISMAWTGVEYGWLATGQESWYLGETPSDGREPSDRMDRARIATLWTLAQQKRISDGAEPHADRSSTRRTVRAGLPPDAAKVRTLDIRKPAGSHDGKGGTVEYSHRWVVSGHWRNQWMPSRGVHRAQWIAPHVKGPDDKPLVVREDVRVVR